MSDQQHTMSVPMTDGGSSDDSFYGVEPLSYGSDIAHSGHFLGTFKTGPCPLMNSTCPRRESDCPYYHSATDHRRDPRHYTYSHFRCKNEDHSKAKYFWENRRCPYAHNQYEASFHPDMWHTEACKRGTTCALVYCSFYHCLRDRVEPVHVQRRHRPPTTRKNQQRTSSNGRIVKAKQQRRN